MRHEQEAAKPAPDDAPPAANHDYDGSEDHDETAAVVPPGYEPEPEQAPERER